jgi:hypothetical protein
MKPEILEMLRADGRVVEYVRTVEVIQDQDSLKLICCSRLMSRFTAEQQQAIREGRTI